MKTFNVTIQTSATKTEIMTVRASSGKEAWTIASKKGVVRAWIEC